MTKRLEVYKCELCGNIVEVLHASGDEARARRAIAAARARVLARADLMSSPRWRASFLEAVEENARTLALAEAWGAA